MTLEQKMDVMMGKMDLTIEKMDQKFEQIDRRFEQIDQRFEQIDQRLKRLENTTDLMKNDISALQIGQHEMGQELNIVSERVTVTYNLALENWGNIVESKVRLNRLEAGN
ncbi:MAG: hypothetical protein PUJ55_07410 [Clostridiales bacterium]|nr:hypothetical protein [Roseburia sp.]MDD7636747.1 hypothetical protein [Clostridiales bacterium]MDY4112086.1 hypothetical protein [Roseburia sp.]